MAGGNFLLTCIFLIILSEVSLCTSLIYTPSCRKCEGWRLGPNLDGCNCTVGHVAIIDDTEKLGLLESKVNSLSTLRNEAFFIGVMRKNASQQYKDHKGRVVKINSSFVNDSFCNEQWCWILLQKNRLKAVNCNSSNYYFCERPSEPHTPQPSQFFTIASHYTFVRSSCECEVLNQRLVRINDSKSLRELETTELVEHKEYWTSLRYQGGTYYFDNCSSTSIKVDTAIIRNNTIRWSNGSSNCGCFSLKKETNNSYLLRRNCSDRLRYICEQKTPMRTRTFLSAMISAVTTSKSISTTTRITVTSASITPKPLPDFVTSYFEKLTRKVVATTEITQTSSKPKALATSSTHFSTTPPTESLSSKFNAEEWVSEDKRVVATTEITPTSTKPRALATSSTHFSTAPPTESSSSKFNAEEELKSQMRALDVGEKDSLQDAATISNAYFEGLKNDTPGDNGINILAAAQELVIFAIKYRNTHKQAKQTQVMSQKWFAMKVQQIPANKEEAISFSLNETDFSTGETDIARISIPLAAFEGQENAVVVNIIYNGIEEWIPSIGNVTLENGATISNLTLGSRIVSSTVYPKPNSTLKKNVTVVFSSNMDAEEEVTPHCVFWDFMLKSDVNGSWSKRGCSLVKKIDNEITCSCNHLTNFAVLMQIGSKEVPSGHKYALEVITYVGCGLSLVGEALAIVAYWILMNLKEEQIQIRFNLVVAIAIAQITFLAGIEASALEGLCIFVAGLIHYFYLAAFAWMLFEGVYLYLMVVKVFNTVIKIRLFYAVAWGLPLLIVLLSMLIASTQDGGIQGYVHGDFCWVSFTNNLIWTFVTPVLVVCSINTVLLGRVVNEIVKMQSGNTSELEKGRQGVKACAVLFPLLGLTWVFGILSVTDAGLVFQYIFTILNSLQGLFIFILHVLRNADVRAAYFRKKRNWKAARSIGTSHTANHDSIALGSSNMRSERPDSRSKSYFTSPRSERSVIGYDKPFAFDHDRCMTPVDT